MATLQDMIINLLRTQLNREPTPQEINETLDQGGKFFSDEDWEEHLNAHKRGEHFKRPVNQARTAKGSNESSER